MTNINELKFDENGLIPAVIIDAKTNAVLMLAYMNMESLRISITSNSTCFWSRSRNELWRKGASSGNTQSITNIKTDCDKDALMISVNSKGPACHTGSQSCFFNDILIQPDSEEICSPDEIIMQGEEVEKREVASNFTLRSLFEIIKNRQTNPKSGSYTTYLFDKGIDKILKKLGEESTEVVIAGKGSDKAQTIYEIADLTYHTMVLMAEMGITPEDIINELASRHSGS